MSKSKLVYAVLAVFLLVGTIPLVLGVNTENGTSSENPSIAAPLTKEEKSSSTNVTNATDGSGVNLTTESTGGSLENEYYDVTVQTIDTVDDTGLTSVYLQDSSGNDLGWFWISCPTDTQELEVYSTLLTSRQYHDSVTVYTDSSGYIYRVTY